MGFRKLLVGLCVLGGLIFMLTACDKDGQNVISVDTGKTYQTMQGFGASAAWWAQDVGGWTEVGESGEAVRDEILTLLYGDTGSRHLPL